MLRLARAGDLADHVGRELGCSEWLLVDQALVSAFATLTGDHAWHHVDAARAARELPGGRTIAHGLLLMALVPKLYRQIVDVAHFSARDFNYGFDKVRFIAPVPVGARVRLRARVLGMEPKPDARVFRREVTLEHEGRPDKPVMSAQWLLFVGAA